jgi:dTDP-4-dehydrorhamnose reductase
MLKILVLGANGMLGHKMTQVLSRDFIVHATIRNSPSFDLENNIIFHENIDIKSGNNLIDLINNIMPDYVLNCIGIIKQLENIDEKNQDFINSFLPNFLAENIPENTRLIHFSTDCVFDGKTGNYSENDKPTASDSYGISKFRGEPISKNTMVLRTSIIGHELGKNISLVSWFLNQKSEVSGFNKAIFSGFPTVVLANMVNKIIKEQYFSNGLFHLAADPISKYDLLEIINNQYKLKKKITKNNNFLCDRSLNPLKFKNNIFEYSYHWEYLIKEMYDDYILYNSLYK